MLETAVESPLTLTIHGATLLGIATILAVLFRQHKIWVRMKDRLNSLWFKHCKEIDEPFIPLENGK